LLTGSLWAGSASAQGCEAYNHLAVNDVLLARTSGPCYFTGYGDSQNAFAQADGFAAALGASVRLEEARLVFERAGLQVSLAVAAQPQQGLERRPDALVINGDSRESLLGIEDGDAHYVPINPVAKALGATVDWDPQTRIIFVDMPAATAPRSSQAQSPEEAQAPGETHSNVQTDVRAETQSNMPGQKHMNRPPRVGLNHEQGYTRVVLDLPVGVAYTVAVGDKQMLLTLPEVVAEAYSDAPGDLYLQHLQLYPISGGTALKLEAGHSLDTTGRGFSLGLIPADSNNPYERLFVDLGPALRAENIPVSGMVEVTAQEAQELAAVRALPRANGLKVVIDPGHGGDEPGTTTGPVTEASVVLAISLKVRGILEAKGVEVVMTREGDYFIELSERANMATTDHNVFVAVHANSTVSREASGIETYVFGVPMDEATLQQAIRENTGAEGREVGKQRTEEALASATSIAGMFLRQEQLEYSTELATAVQEKMVGVTGWRDRGVKENAYWVLRHARTPAILVEVGFMSNPEEGRQLATEGYQTKLAQAIAEGILEFLDLGGQLSSR
jgi:N-acetylmuramoyl-L-alanine amidase